MKILLIYFVLSTAFINSAISQLLGSPWPKFRCDLQNTGQSPYSGPSMPGRILKNKIDSNIVSSPAIGINDTIYIGTWHVGLVALSPDFSKKWSAPTYGAIPSSPAIDLNGIVYVGSWNYDLLAILSDGLAKYRFHTGRDIKSSPTIGIDGTIYFGSSDSNFYAINSDFSLKWKYKTKDWITYNSPAIDLTGMIYISSWDGNLYVFDPKSPQPKKPKWLYRSGGNISSSPAIATDGTIYIHVFKTTSELHAVNHDSSNKWICQTYGYKINDDYPHSSPAIGIDRTIYIGSNDHKLYAITPDGTAKWSYETKTPIRSSAAIGSDGKIFFGSDDGLYVLTLDGNLKWYYEIKSGIRSSPAIGQNGQLYLSSFDGMLYAFLGDRRAPLKEMIEDSLNLDQDADYWGIYHENTPEWIMENVSEPSLDGKALRCGITGGDSSYSNVHCYRNFPVQKDKDRFYLSLYFIFNPTTFNENNSVIQALEFTMNKWLGEKRYEWALQWQNVGQGAPQWRYWDPHQNEKWISIGISDSLEGNVWHRLEMTGEIDKNNHVHYLSFAIDSREYNLDSISVSPSIAKNEPDRLAIAFQLDGTQFMFPYDVYVDNVNFYALESDVNNLIASNSFDAQHYLLEQNYPNPFNPSTTIKFVMAKESYVLLQIFNIRGELAYTLVNQRLNRGSHFVNWEGQDQNGNQCPSGVYFCQLKAGTFSAMKKIMLFR